MLESTRRTKCRKAAQRIFLSLDNRGPSMWPHLSSSFYGLPCLMQRRSLRTASASVDDVCWWLPDPWGSLAPHDLLSVLTSLGQAPDPACALGACEAQGGQPLLIIGAPCEPVPRNELPTPAQDLHTCPTDLCALEPALDVWLGLQDRTRWQHPCVQEAPEDDQ
jgi:hypothetical protein